MKITYKSFVPQIIDKIERSDIRTRRKAAIHLVRRLRKNVSGRGTSAPGGLPAVFSGNLKKSMKYKVTKNGVVMAGTIAPHAHLVEDGHKPVQSKSKRPFFKRTFSEEKNTMIDIISEKWF